MTGESEHIEKQFINEIGNLAENLGMPRSTGQLYAHLYMASEPVSIEQMVDMCDINMASVEARIRELEQWGAVSKIEDEEDENTYYEANRDIPEIIIRRLQTVVPPHMKTLATLLEKAESRVETIDEREKDKKEFYRTRLKEIQRLKRGVERLVNNMDRLYRMGRRFM